ncbi:MAG: ParB family chromosome partitioning protein [Planctomycetota bacterium]|jgi:ParB family chromosome partitioning protein
MERRLGRGLGSLLGQTNEAGQEPEAAPESKKGSGASGPKASAPPAAPPAGPVVDVAAEFVEVVQIRRNPDQPRKTFDSAALEDLRQSIERHGVLQPICVRRVKDGFEIVSGERRWRAARSAGLARIPATIKEGLDDTGSLELAIVENVQREDLDALEKARGYQALMERVGLTQEAVAERVGLKRSSVANHLRLLELPADAQEALVSGLITMGHARALLGLKGEKEILGALGQVVRKELSVRETEQLAKGGEQSSQATGGKDKGSGAQTKELAAAAPWVNDMEAQIRQNLGVKVTLRNGKKYKGSITLDYANREELDRIVALIAPKETI